MKNGKGFTLIELLAVIVILAIIALIATPIILNMIENAKKGAAKDSAYGYVEAIEYNNSMADLGINNNYTKILDGKDLDVTGLDVKVKGSKPDSGIITIEKGNVINADLCINGYNVLYDGKEASIGDNNKCSSSKGETVVKYVCNETIYDNGPITVEKYEEICKDYIFEGEYLYSENADGTITINGFKEATPEALDGIWALPATIDGKTVTTIASNAFSGRPAGNVLIVAPSIQTINKEAFISNSLTALAMTNGLTTLGDSVFKTNNLTSVKLPDTLNTVGINLFDSNSNLVTVDIGGGFTPMDPGTLGVYNSVKKLVIGSNELEKELILNNNAFVSHTNLEEVIIRKNVKKISNNLFQGDSKLSKVTFEGNIESIGLYAFKGNISLKKINLPNTLTNIGEGAFMGSGLENIIIPDSVKTIGGQAFYGCPIKAIKLGKSIEQIDHRAFISSGSSTTNSQIEELIIPSSITTFGEITFSELNIKNLIIEEGVTTGDRTFSNNTIENLVVGSNNYTKSQKIVNGSFSGSKIKNITINSSVESIGSSAFSGKNIEKLTLNEGIKSIGNNAFYDNKIQTLTIPNSVTNISTGAFNSNQLETITVGSGLVTKGSDIFSFNNSLKTINDNSGIIECNDALNSTPTINNLKTGATTTCS